MRVEFRPIKDRPQSAAMHAFEESTLMFVEALPMEMARCRAQRYFALGFQVNWLLDNVLSLDSADEVELS
jgi:hypothetical protein